MIRRSFVVRRMARKSRARREALDAFRRAADHIDLALTLNGASTIFAIVGVVALWIPAVRWQGWGILLASLLLYGASKLHGWRFDVARRKARQLAGLDQ